MKKNKNKVKIKVEENNIRENRKSKITSKIIFHSIQIALLKKILKETRFSKTLLKLVFNQSTDTENTTIELRARDQIDKHLKASIRLATELIKISELEDIIDPIVVVPLGTTDLLRGYAELIPKTGNDEDIHTYNLSYGNITKGEYIASQERPFSVIKNTTIKTLLLTTR